MDLAQVADELYALDPADFTASRDERARSARADGDKDLGDAIKKLRRPTVSAWLVNRLVREAAGQLDELLDLGESLRAAQQALAGDELRRLSARRRPAVHAVAQEAKRLAAGTGRTVTDQVEREVEATLEAALADPGAAEAVRSGRLTTALAYAGFGAVDLADAVAVPHAAPARNAPATSDAAAGTAAAADVAAPAGAAGDVAARGGRKQAAAGGLKKTTASGSARLEAQERREAEAAARERRKAELIAQDVRDAEGAAQEAADDLDSAARRVTELRELRQAAQRRIEELEQQLERAQTEEAMAARVLRDAERSRDAAARLASDAQRRLARARAKIEEAQQAYARYPRHGG